MTDKAKEQALEYHRLPFPGKFKISPTKALTTAKDLSLAYSPGVAAASEAIHAEPDLARELTVRGNLVGVISNGTAVLGLGDIGPLAAKPVMEGKGVLFKKFAGIDVFDIEIDEKDPDKLIDIIASLAPTFGGINLEDIKAPECFEVERALKDKLDIPVFHDDQHQRGALGRLRRRGGGPGVFGSVGHHGLKARAHHGVRSPRRGLSRPHRRHGRQKSGLCHRHRCPDLG
jgi:malate dehydrogenase (oxaloacetate-decarboxylating)(NADP+)